MSRPTKVFVWFLLGTWLLQAAWISAVPPFRGLDEHEHVYKAAAVARGDWSPSHEASPDGWGERVWVPHDLVDAATAVCASLPYTKPDSCWGSTPPGAEQRQVASSAARYNPAFYAVVGTAALPFEGTTALYAMRLAGALLCSLLLAWAASVLASRVQAQWGVLCLAAAVTPIVLYSTGVAAPNGLELGAAALLWCALIAIRDWRGPSGPPPHVVAVTVAGVVLALSRTLGPLWLALILAAGAALMGRARLTELLRAARVRASLAVIVAAAVAGVAWTVSARTNSPGGPLRVTDEAWGVLPARWALWVFQSVAAFPARNEIAPLAVYALVFLAWALLLLFGLRRSSRRVRAVVVAVGLLSTAIPSVATLLTYAELGDAWQGRYSYPFAMGVILLCAAGSPPRLVGTSRSGTVLLALGCVVAVAAPNLVSVIDVARGERAGSPLAGSPAWWDAPDPVLALLVLAGSAMWFVALRVCAGAPAAPAAEAGREPVPHATRASSLAR